MDITWILGALIIAFFTYVYIKQLQKHKYWKRKGVTHMKPKPIFGNMLDVLLLKISRGELYKKIYNKFPNEKFVGLYEVMTPAILLRDPKLIEKILVKDFQYFVDHSQFYEEDGLFSKGLFQLKGSTWRAVRYKLSPAFTSGKLKLMFDSMLDCTEGMITKIKQNFYKDYDLNDAFSNFTIDIIANIVFGIQMNDEKAKKEFANMGSTIFRITPRRFIKLVFIYLFPKFSQAIGLRILSSETTKYFQQIIKNTFDQRIDGNYQRNDYLQHLIRLKQKGSIEVQSKDEDDLYLDLDGKAPVENVEITELLLQGQAFQFLTAGFEPLSNTLTFAMYDLARFPEVQERARKQIKEVLREHGGYTYKSIKEMTYLEQCVQETLRMYPLLPFLTRVCTKNYTTDDGLEIEKGTKVIISLDGLHRDPKFYEDPEVFRPERLPPNSLRKNFTYIPFGDGPRICIGLRFAIIVLETAMAKLLENFKFQLSPKTKIPFEIHKQQFIPIPASPILFNITPV